jgi:hypothetical protein
VPRSENTVVAVMTQDAPEVACVDVEPLFVGVVAGD